MIERQTMVSILYGPPELDAERIETRDLQMKDRCDGFGQRDHIRV